MLALDAEDFLAELERRFTLKLGAIALASRVEAFPLASGSRAASSASGWRWSATPRISCIRWRGRGSISALRDVAALAERVIEPLRLGLDPGDPATLAAYQRDRRFDVVASGFGMDAMNRLFSNDIAPLRFARDLGLRLVDRAPALKRCFMAEAAGAGARAPRLLRGLGL